MRKLFLVAIGGGLGTLLRFVIVEWMAPAHPWPPLSILIINVSGCFLISFLHFVSDPSGRIYIRPNSRLFLLVGFCGGYTTFSTFSLLSFEAIQHARWGDVWANILLSHLLCLIAAGLGYRLSSPASITFTRLLQRQRRNRGFSKEK